MHIAKVVVSVNAKITDGRSFVAVPVGTELSTGKDESGKNNINYAKCTKCNKNFKEREGDWECSKCKNLNYCFRKKCNRCHCDKNESQQQYSITSHNLLSILKGIN